MSTRSRKTRYTPEQRAELIAKVKEIRANGVNLHEACKQAGVAYGSYFTWITKGKRGRKPGKAAKNLPAVIPSTNRKNDFMSIPADDTHHEQKTDFTCIVIKGSDRTVASLAQALGSLIRQ